MSAMMPPTMAWMIHCKKPRTACNTHLTISMLMLNGPTLSVMGSDGRGSAVPQSRVGVATGTADGPAPESVIGCIPLLWPARPPVATEPKEEPAGAEDAVRPSG